MTRLKTHITSICLCARRPLHTRKTKTEACAHASVFDKILFFFSAGQLRNFRKPLCDLARALPPVREQAIAAILDPLISISTFSSAFLAQCIEWAITEQAVEILGMHSFMARKILARHVLKKSAVLLFHPISLPILTEP